MTRIAPDFSLAETIISGARTQKRAVSGGLARRVASLFVRRAPNGCPDVLLAPPSEGFEAGTLPGPVVAIGPAARFCPERAFSRCLRRFPVTTHAPRVVRPTPVPRHRSNPRERSPAVGLRSSAFMEDTDVQPEQNWCQ